MSPLRSAWLLTIFCLVLGMLAARGDAFQTVDPDWMPSRLYFFGGALRPRVMELISDPDAPTGAAGHSVEGVHVGGTAADSYTYEPIPGRYRTTFFFKVADNTGDEGILSFGIWGAVAPDPEAAGDGMKHLKASDFAQPGVYQQFAYEWDYYEYGFMVNAVQWFGRGEIWWGGVETQLLRPFTDDELLALWRDPPPHRYYVPFPPADQSIPDLPADLRVQPGAPRVHMVQGMFFDKFGVEEALPLLEDVHFTESETLSGAQERDIAPRFPALDDLFADHNVVVLANVDLRRLGVVRRFILREFVERGGGLLVLGGPWTYGRSPMRGTWLDELLPVGVKGPVDWVEVPRDSTLRWTDAAPEALRELPLGAAGLHYVHDADLREGGEVLLMAAGRPVLVTAQQGRGRVAAFLGTPMGEAAPGGSLFFETPEWPPVMARLLEWLSGAL